MPCMGPSKDFAYFEGEKAFEQVLTMLKEEYGVCSSNFLVSEEDLEKYNDKQRMMYNHYKQSEREFNEKAEAVKLAIQELIWTDHANGF